MINITSKTGFWLEALFVFIFDIMGKRVFSIPGSSCKMPTKKDVISCGRSLSPM
jgi:hypothetical protein